MGNDRLIGTSFDEYRIEQALGTGGMAQVYRAIDVKLKRYVALKVITPALRDNSDNVSRFEREAQAIARLEHPNIVQIYRYGEANGLLYIAMQYIEGVDLGGLIADYKSTGEVMPIGDIVRVVQEVGAALDYAHSRDVIHRDVKPSNIQVDNRGRALLTDFGLALLSDVGTRGEVFGSPHYVAPEQTVSSKNAVPQSDIYSLGVTLFEMLTGEKPFIGGEAVEISRRHLVEPPPAPSQRNAAISPAVDEVVLRALEKDPFDRYPTCAEFSTALLAAVERFEPRSQPASGSGRRPSLVLLPQKVHQHLSAPSLPDIDDTPGVASAQSISLDTFRDLAATIQGKTTSGNPWKRAVIFAGVLFLMGSVLLLTLMRQREQGGLPPSETLAMTTLPESTLPIVEQAASPTLIPSPFPTVTPIVLPTQAPLQPPTFAAPTTIPITAGAVPAVPLSTGVAPALPTVLPQMTLIFVPGLAADQAVRIYFQLVSQQRYDVTWNLLTDAFKQKFNCCAPTYNYGDYAAWWDSVNVVEFGDVRTVSQSEDRAVVYAELFYVMNNGQRSSVDSSTYIVLVYDPVVGWRLDDKRATP